MGRDSLTKTIEENLDKVDAHLPGMEKFTSSDLRFIIRLITDDVLVNRVDCLGWGFWPVENKGYYDPAHLRIIADFIDIQNKPFWDEYESWCKEQWNKDEELLDPVEFDEFEEIVQPKKGENNV